MLYIYYLLKQHRHVTGYPNTCDLKREAVRQIPAVHINVIR